MIKAQINFPSIDHRVSTGLDGHCDKYEIAEIMDEYRARIDSITEKLNRRPAEPRYRTSYHQNDNDHPDAELEELIGESKIKVQWEMDNLIELENELYTELGRLYQVITEAQKKLESREPDMVEFMSVKKQ